MKIYLAARYSRREELCLYREQLRSIGHDVQARWLDGEHQINESGAPIGNQGEALVEGDAGGTSEEASALRSKFALDDWEDVNAAELVISFTEPPRSKANRGGRHVEYGIALANKARVIVVGHRENIFHWLPQVEFYETWQQARESVERDRVRNILECPWCSRKTEHSKVVWCPSCDHVISRVASEAQPPTTPKL